MLRVLALLIVGAVLVALLVDPSVMTGIMGEEAQALSVDTREMLALATTLALLLLVIPTVLGGYKGRIGTAVRDLVTWTMMGMVLVAGYSYRDELGRIAYRIAGEFSPPGSAISVEQRQSGERAVRIRRRGDGHFVARVSVNGASVPMLVDTGASAVVLRQSDARALGLDTSRLRYTVPVQTANGLAYAAHARLEEIGVGPIALVRVDALVAQPGALKESLLGMSFLSRLRSYEFSGEFLTFRN